MTCGAIRLRLPATCYTLATTVTEVDPAIPNRSLFRAAEVCEVARIQPYVLRTWEMEFPHLGVVKNAGGRRVYRRSDVAQVLRIRQLVFEEGLTLAGARRRLEEDGGAVADDVGLEEMNTKIKDVEKLS